MSSLQEFTAARDGSALEKEGVGYLSLENKALQSRLTEQHQQYAAAVTKVTTELNNTKRELVSALCCLWLLLGQGRDRSDPQSSI